MHDKQLFLEDTIYFSVKLCVCLHIFWWRRLQKMDLDLQLLLTLLNKVQQIDKFHVNQQKLRHTLNTRFQQPT